MCFLGQNDPFLLLCSSEKLTTHRFAKTWGWVNNDKIVILGQQTSYDSQKLLSWPKARNMSSRLHLAKSFSQLNTISSPGPPSFFLLSQYIFPSSRSLPFFHPLLQLSSSRGTGSYSSVLYLSFSQRTAEGHCNYQKE